MTRSSNQSTQLVCLARELQRKIATFLLPVDALNLGQTCRSIHQDLALSSLNPPFPLNYRPDKIDQDLIVRRGPKIPVIYSKRTHSITLKGQQDCGITNIEARDAPQTSKLFLMAFDRKEPSADVEVFSKGQIVAEVTLTRGISNNIDITFQPKPNKVYFLWYRGFAIQSSRILAHSIVLDNAQRSLARQYRVSCGSVRPFPSILMHIMWCLLSIR